MSNDKKCMECDKAVPKKTCGWMVGSCGCCDREHWVCHKCINKLGIKPMPEA